MTEVDYNSLMKRVRESTQTEYWFAIAAVTNYHTQSSLNNTNVSSDSSVGQRSNQGTNRFFSTDWVGLLPFLFQLLEATPIPWLVFTFPFLPSWER